MNCLRCDNHEFARKENAVIEQEFKGELLTVNATAMACTKCGWVTVALDQLDELRRRTADAYREKHELLTSDQIRAFRKLLRMSQREFAAFLRVGEASVKRWETWLVQEKGNDELIRTKFEKELQKQFSQQTTMKYWVSGDYVATTQHSGHATGEVATKSSLSCQDNWMARRPRSSQSRAPRLDLLNGAANEELALAA